MSRTKLPPRLYFNEARGRWVIRFDGWMRRTPFKLTEKTDAQKLLDSILGQKSWAYAVRSLQPAKRPVAKAPWARSETMGVIYFVSTEEVENYPIKIGFSAIKVESRLVELQTGNPYPLEILATAKGTYGQEQSLHIALAEHRISGEWFRRCTAVEQILGAAMIGELFPQRRICAETVPTVEIT